MKILTVISSSLFKAFFLFQVIVFYLIVANAQLFENISSNPNPPYQSNLLTSMRNSSCHRSWYTDATLTENILNEANTSLIYLPRREILEMHRTCSRDMSNNFCILDRSPSLLKWAFTSVLVCKNSNSKEKFGISYGETRRIRRNRRTPSKFIKLAHENIDEAVIENAMRIRRKRDFFNMREGFTALAIIVVAIAKCMNSSILLIGQHVNKAVPRHRKPTEPHVNKSSVDHRMDIFKSPTVRPRLFARALSKYDKMAFLDSNKYAQIDSVDFNFVYCDAPKLKIYHVWDLTVIIHAFHITVWIILTVALFTCSLILANSWQFENDNAVVSTFFTLLSCLLGGNLRLERSVLFYTWVVSCIILDNYYTGTMTSLLITPLKEGVLTKLSQLASKNYSLAFTNVLPTVFLAVNASAFGVEEDEHQLIKENSTAHFFEHTKEIRILRSVLMSNQKDRHMPLSEFLHEVAFSEGKAAFGPWTYCMVAYNSLVEYIRIRNSLWQPKDRRPRHCHLGKNLISSGGLYWGFFPPKNELPTDIFQTFLETGIYQYWMIEFYGVGYAARVQNRVKVKSSTEIVEENENEGYSPLGLQGHILTVFLLWSLGVALSIVVICCEVIFKRTFVNQTKPFYYPSTIFVN